jgi:hypothetical protein
MKNNREDRDEWLSHKVKFWIQMAVIITTVFGAWATMNKSIALLEQKLNILETNHLVHIQESVTRLGENLDVTRDRLIGIEAKMDIILKGNKFN